MKILRLVGLCVLPCLVVWDVSAEGPRPSTEPVALVYRLQGEATLTLSSEERRPLRLFDRLPVGAILEVGPGSRLALAFANGRRYELGERSRVTLGPADLSLRFGPVRPLQSVPPLPRLLPLAEDERPGVHAAAPRLRAERIAGLYPRGGVATLAGATVLRFEPVEGGGKYAVEVHDRQGNVIFAAETTASSVSIPAGLLRLGMRYHWTVRTVERVGPVAKGEADFITLPRQTAEAREALRKAVEKAGDGASLALLAEIDRSLGLWAEAHEELRAALERSPGDTALAEELAAVERRLEDDSADVPEGVVIEDVAPGSAAERAGLRPGDELSAWSSASGGSGALRTPFDLGHVKVEQAPRGPITLQGFREGKEKTWNVPPGIWGIEARPNLAPDLLALYEQGRQRIAAGDLEAGVAAWRGAAEEAKEEGKRWLAAWFLSKVGSALGELLRWSEADAAYGEAVEQVEQGRLWAIAAHLLREWGTTFEKRSEWSRAEDCFRRSLECDQKLASESLEIALSLHQMGGVARQRGELAKAGGYHRRSLAIRERLAPGSLEIATSLNNLGTLASWRGDLVTAEEYYRRSLAIREKRAPGSFDVAASLNNLGVVAWKRGDLATAEEHYRRSLQKMEKPVFDSPEVATRLENGLGIYFSRPLAFRWGDVPDDGDVAVAEGYFQRAVTILEKLGPAPPGLAEAQYNLGRAKRLQRRFATAAERLCRAVDTLEIQRGRLGGADTTVFGATSASYYAACVGARIESGKQEEAFRSLERGRARAFLAQLAERHDLAASELPAEIATRRKELASAYDETQSALSDLGPIHDRARLDELKDQLREIRSLQDELAVRMRRESPRYASLHEPQTLDLVAARRALDPGTVLLSYAVDEDATYLLVIQSARVRGKGITAFSLPVGEKDLRAAIATFRNLLQNPGSDRRALSAQAQKLYDLLLRPAERRLAGAARLLVSPDGPLHILPFAALVRRGSYLAEWKPIHSVLSASVYAEIGRSRRPSVGPAHFDLAAFGAPIYPRLSKKRDEAPAANLEVATAVSRGLSLDPLPFSQQEVEGIASLFPEARTFLGSEATEESAKAIAPQARLLHFACHGLLDEHSPLDSALALTIPEKPAPGQDNGLLQAWEIFDSLRLDADLVTLSACDSGLGKEMGGEGLIGLTRAFQYAGARSVLASLWSVSDVSTAGLMKRLYGHLRAGKAKDEALQAAQIELIRSPEFSHPYHWAAFQLVGDWK